MLVFEHSECEQLNFYSKSICYFKSGYVTEANGKIAEWLERSNAYSGKVHPH